MYRVCRFLIAAAISLFPCLPLMAQAVSGTILGSVQDSSGAAVPGTSVTIVNIETGLTRSVVTDSSGEYAVPSLPPGLYSVSAEVKGFKKVSLSGIRLNVDQKARVDLQLEVGEVSESIQVQGAVALVQSDSSESGVTVNESQIAELPLNGRDFVQLTRLIPGVTRGVPGSISRPCGDRSRAPSRRTEISGFPRTMRNKNDVSARIGCCGDCCAPLVQCGELEGAGQSPSRAEKDMTTRQQ